MARIRANNAPILDPSPKAERTRAAILAAAEHQFALHGFVATRLEDVAAAVGLKRAALFYHFRDKQSLYDAMIADAFGALGTRLLKAFSAELTLAQQVEQAVEAWVDTIMARPTLARLILRHSAEADTRATQGIFPDAEPIFRTAVSVFEQGVESGEFEPIHDDFYLAASAVLGATVFYVAALAPLLPNTDFDPLAPEQVAAHKRDTVKMLRMMLGIRPPRRTKRKAR